MQARPKYPHVEVWQYHSEDRVQPTWVINATLRIENELFLKRRSGCQLIEPNDWLVRDLDAEPLWFSPITFQRHYEVIE
jgi:hypothetical protein